MFRILIIFFILNFNNSVFASSKEKVISKMLLTNNLSFNFIQTINNKSENGKCIIEYPKKIRCVYDNFNKKIIVSNGKSLAIKTKVSYYLYPLSKTSLMFLLDKKYLISKINALEPRDINNKYLIFTFFKNNSEINVFFDKKSFSLAGWQTEDIYQNLTVTIISSIKINKEIDNKIFILPANN
jgi:outer membrane lipoprotein-sorting protein